MKKPTTYIFLGTFIFIILFSRIAFDKDEKPEKRIPEQSMLDAMAEAAEYPVIRDQYGRQVS